ncbi:MAG: hypothetical protein J7L58_02295 [Thermoplasmata archaeon]|nr:hypothetical protein [Thermoplasmata archaeon]
MDAFTRRIIILMAIAAFLLVYLVAVYYIWAGEMTVVTWRIFYASITVIILAAIIFLSRGNDIKMKWWFWKLIILLILLAVSLIISAFMHLLQYF